MESQIDILKQHIAENYEPAPNFREATLRLTTTQIIARIDDHFLGTISGDEIISTFTELGYKYESVELSFFWLINTK